MANYELQIKPSAVKEIEKVSRKDRPRVVQKIRTPSQRFPVLTDPKNFLPKRNTGSAKVTIEWFTPLTMINESFNRKGWTSERSLPLMHDLQS